MLYSSAGHAFNDRVILNMPMEENSTWTRAGIKLEDKHQVEGLDMFPLFMRESLSCLEDSMEIDGSMVGWEPPV